MNCPICNTGVLEEAGYVSIFPTEHGEIHTIFSAEKIPGSEIVRICSLDPCSYLETKTAPGILTTIKRLKKHSAGTL